VTWQCRQLIINALVFNVGRPFRKPLWSNPWLLLSLIGLTIFNLYVLFAPGG
jgi:cation-transporting P-type ATPase 13A2